MVSELKNLAMAEGTRFHKELAQFEEKFEKLGDKLRTDLFAELKQAMDHFNAEVGAIKQLLPGLIAVQTNPTSPAVVEMDSSEAL